MLKLKLSKKVSQRNNLQIKTPLIISWMMKIKSVTPKDTPMLRITKTLQFISLWLVNLKAVTQNVLPSWHKLWQEGTLTDILILLLLLTIRTMQYLLKMQMSIGKQKDLNNKEILDFIFLQKSHNVVLIKEEFAPVMVEFFMVWQKELIIKKTLNNFRIC